MTVHVVSPIQMSVCRRYVARFRLARYLAYLELSVLEGLKGRSTTNLAANVLHALNYLGDNLPAIRLLCWPLVAPKAVKFLFRYGRWVADVRFPLIYFCFFPASDVPGDTAIW